MGSESGILVIACAIFLYYTIPSLINYFFGDYNDWAFVRAYRNRKKSLSVEEKEWIKNKTSYFNGGSCFEFYPEMGLYSDYNRIFKDIVYVESEYNERFNRFFQEHRSLKLNPQFKYVYLPILSEELTKGAVAEYLCPSIQLDSKFQLILSSDYPMQYLVHPKDKGKIKQGMFFFRGDKAGRRTIKGDYFPLYEGSDEEIIAQLDSIAKNIYRKLHPEPKYWFFYGGGHVSKYMPPLPDDYADEHVTNEIFGTEDTVIIEEVRQKIKLLKEHGLTENLLRRLLHEEPKLSRLVITKDMRIILPDYNNMEIEMEPINKAVYLLFLKHPNGIVFKDLPDYRKELAEIYQKIKPLGLNERALKSIEGVTNPCLNSINEKCARIRGAFISKFDESLAENYFIFGPRGEAKKISLPRGLIIWE